MESLLPVPMLSHLLHTAPEIDYRMWYFRNIQGLNLQRHLLESIVLVYYAGLDQKVSLESITNTSVLLTLCSTVKSAKSSSFIFFIFGNDNVIQRCLVNMNTAVPVKNCP